MRCTWSRRQAGTTLQKSVRIRPILVQKRLARSNWQYQCQLVSNWHGHWHGHWYWHGQGHGRCRRVMVAPTLPSCAQSTGKTNCRKKEGKKTRPEGTLEEHTRLEVGNNALKEHPYSRQHPYSRLHLCTREARRSTNQLSKTELLVIAAKLQILPAYGRTSASHNSNIAQYWQNFTI